MVERDAPASVRDAATEVAVASEVVRLRGESARLRYELARLRDRRTVRAGLAVGELRRGGVGAAWTALRGRGPRLDVPGPAVVPIRPVFPHLRAVHTGDGHLLRTTCIHEAVTPASCELVIRRDRPDLVVVDAVSGWTAADLARLDTAARDAGSRRIAAGPSAAVAFPGADLVVATDLPFPGAGLELGPMVDVRVWSPAGLDDAGDAGAAGRCDDAAALLPADAHTQPVVAVGDVAAVGVRRCLELLAAGALVVTGPDDALARALGPLAAEVVGDHASREERVAALLADAERRRRTSVRLRRHVHATASTRAGLVGIVEALHLDVAPVERVSVLLATRRTDRLPQVAADLAAQHHTDVEVVLVAHGDTLVPERLPGIARVERVAGDRPLGAVLNAGLDVATGTYVAKVDDDDRYGPHHLTDLVLAVRHSGADLVGKRVHGVHDEAAGRTFVPAPGGEERFEDHLPGGTLLAPADVLRAVRWRHVPRGVDTELVRAVHLAGGSAYTTHRYGYVRVRHGDHLYDPDTDWPGEQVDGLDLRLLET